MKRRFLAVSLLMLVANITMGQRPETSDPEGRLIEGLDAPGEYPTGVTAANIDFIPLPGSEIDGTDEDVFRAEFPAAGPIAWTSSRMNAGDIALSIGPALPENPLSYPSGDEGFQQNFQALNQHPDPIDPDTTELTTLAWRVSSNTGAHFTTTRHNGVDGGYVLPDLSPVGPIHGITYVSHGPARQGWGFGMDDGVFANGNDTTTEVHTGHAGFADGANEAVFDIATAYFPYEAGWKGAWILGAEEGEATFNGASPDLEPEEVTWEMGLANVQLHDIDSASDGMLFVAPANGSSSSRIASAFPNESGGWTTTIRLDENDDISGKIYQDFGDDFQFLYIPYSAANLVGAHVDGADGSPINSAGDDRFTLSRQASGQYALSVFEADGMTKKTGDAGMLMLSVADTMADDTSLGSRAFMSYEYDDMSGDFIIESRELVDIGSPTPFDGYGNEFAPSDSDFYFTWVDFASPLSLNFPGDFDANGVLDVDDLDRLIGAIRDGNNDTTFDLDGNGEIDVLDVDVWVMDLKNTWRGDANLDGEFNSADLVAVFREGEYEDALPLNSTWASGDWNADGDFDTSDLVAAFRDGGFEQGPRNATQAVPEPTSILGLLATFSLYVLRSTPYAAGRRIRRA